MEMAISMGHAKLFLDSYNRKQDLINMKEDFAFNVRKSDH